MEEFCVEYFVSIITGSLCGLDFVMFFTAVYKEADDKKNYSSSSIDVNDYWKLETQLNSFSEMTVFHQKLSKKCTV